MVIHANHMLRAAYKAMVEAANAILASGRSMEADRICAPVSEIFSCVGLDRISRKDKERSETLRLATSERRGAAMVTRHGR
jgi:phosphoenolpyruvate phosphomutase